MRCWNNNGTFKFNINAELFLKLPHHCAKHNSIGYLNDVREGEIKDELFALIDEEPDISLLVLGADTKSENAGPLINFLMTKGASRCRVPITVVPGNLSDEQLDALF